MTHHNYPKEYTVHGVSSEMLRGNEDTIYSPAWFVESNGSYFWTWKKSWTHDDLRKVNSGDESFIYFFKESERVPLNEGESVYLAGSEFMDKILSFIKSGDIKFSVSAWEQISYGYYISTMTASAFSAFAESLCLDLWEIVENFLTEGKSADKAKAVAAFDAYTAICFYSADDKKEQGIRRAMVYTRLGDAELLELESHVSVQLDEFFDTTELFHNAVTQRLDALHE